MFDFLQALSIALPIGEYFSELYPEHRNSAVEIVRPPLLRRII